MTSKLQKTIALGHSHMGALRAAYGTPVGPSAIDCELSFYQFHRTNREHIVYVKEFGWRYHPEIEIEVCAALEQIDIDRLAVVFMLQGEQAVSAGLIAPVQPYDFFFPSEVGYTPLPGSEIIPFDILFDLCKEKFRLIADFLDLVAGRLPRAVLALSPPPIVGDRDFILGSNVSHANIAEHIEKFGLPPTVWRVRTWKAHVMALRSIYNERNIPFLDPPAEAYGDDGCLRPDLRADVFHANQAYGTLLLKQIKEFFRQRIK